MSTPDVPWFDLTRQYARLQDEVRNALHEVMAKGDFILGPAVERFETEFAAFVGAKHCLGLNSGTSALHLALLACNVGPGDEVITTPATWISTSWAISYLGARPVFVDIEPDHGCLDPAKVEAALSPRTKAVLPVHLYGQVADLKWLETLCNKHGLVLIEDACQAHGATFHGRHAGTIGRLGCFSFYPGKNLGAYGEAGAVVTDDAALAERIRNLRNHAQSRRHVHDEIGFNMRMEGMQGAVLSTKLRYLPEWIAARRRIAQAYSAAWNSLPALSVPAARPGTEHAWHIYALRVAQREAFQQFLKSRGVQSTVHYPTPVHLQPAYAFLGHRRGDFPSAEALCDTQVTMPLFPELSGAEMDRVIDAVRAWSRQLPLAA